MKRILGLNCLHPDTSAALILNDTLSVAIEEERINRKKHTSDFPKLSIYECLKISNINSEEITDIAFNTNPNSNFFNKSLFFLKNFNFKKNPKLLKKLKKKKNLDTIIKKEINLNKKVKYHFIEHHLSHISSAYYPSKFKDAVGLSIDGSGDFVTLAISICKLNKIKIIKKCYFPNSLGIFYTAMTQFLKFNNFGDEYKIMGLAPYGKPIYFDKLNNLLFKKKSNFYNLSYKYFLHNKSNFIYDFSTNKIPTIYSRQFEDLFKNEKEKYKNIKDFNSNFAASIQKVYEFHFKNIINWIKKKEISKNLVYAGGCALNSTANNFLINDKYFKNIYIPFSPGDNGGSLGAAFYTYYNYSDKIELKNINTPYLGNEYFDEDIEKILLQEKYKKKLKYKKFKYFNDLCDEASKLISNNKIVGWFQGKMEFGPRALGNRSILGDPRNPDMKDIINSKIKKRENFRPFAPSILFDQQKNWYVENFNSEFMSSTLNIKKDKRKLVPAVVHCDDSSRVQSVKKINNSKFYQLIKSFYKKTNVPMLLNTSFNESEPIVRKPQEALDCLLRTGLDGIFINNFYIKKK